MSGFWAWCGRRVRRRYQVWWEDVETLESDLVVGASSHLTVEDARTELNALGPLRGTGYRRIVVEINWRIDINP